MGVVTRSSVLGKPLASGELSPEGNGLVVEISIALPVWIGIGTAPDQISRTTKPGKG